MRPGVRADPGEVDTTRGRAGSGYVPRMSEQPQDQRQDGQVSEVASMDPAAADTPISDDQAVAGYPASESGDAQEGESGPNAAPRHDPPEEGNRSSR